MVPVRRHDGTYVCPNAHQAIRPKPGPLIQQAQL
jgi:hypothetical protein